MRNSPRRCCPVSARHKDTAVKREWFVLHVKPRTEKKVESFLRIYGYFSYLPLWTKVTKIQRRKVVAELPLFPGYVFTRLLPDERMKMLKTNLLVRTIPVGEPRVMIHQLRQVARMLRGKRPVKVVNPFKAGDFVRVLHGPFRGVEGYIKREGAQASLVMNVEILGQAVETSFSPEDLEKA